MTCELHNKAEALRRAIERHNRAYEARRAAQDELDEAEREKTLAQSELLRVARSPQSAEASL